MRERELADSDSFNSVITCTTDYEIEKQFQKSYNNTNSKSSKKS